MNASRITCIECLQPIPLFKEVRRDGMFYCVSCAPKPKIFSIIEKFVPEGYEDKDGFHLGKPPPPKDAA